MTLDLKALREQPHAMTCEATFSECAEANCNCGKDERDALIDELTEARRERDEAEKMRQAFSTESEVVFARAQRAESALAHARAAALKEAARCVASYRGGMKLNDGRDLHRAGLERLAEQVAALSATPATVVCVPVETLGRATGALEALSAGVEDRCELWRRCDSACNCGASHRTVLGERVARARAALAEMAQAYHAPHVRTVKLVEADPDREAVVRALLKAAVGIKGQDLAVAPQCSLKVHALFKAALAYADSVEKLQRKGRKP